MQTYTTQRMIHAAAAVAFAAAATAVAIGSPAKAATLGWSTVEGCTSAMGSVSYQPGLTNVARSETGTLSVTLAGCSSLYSGSTPGTGLLTASLSGTSSTAGVSQRGTFTINWPAGSGLNPSNGTLTLTGPDAAGHYTAGGSITSGAFPGASLGTAFVVTAVNPGATGSPAHPVTLQQVTNTAPVQVQRNMG
ncbi:hypothetical protein ODJ79_27555 [Actinoplanes sp. KI2]|uniref:hypothetical protein n=1 Tax=Actinoplanes sp. KI2 TaxID=2983315 RepID=UPI0021D605C6|nr:hypothetical protein [Actinoplanes sp. KI2]MCU7727493.1 hypothetical protein [Actinoplanes sp. KI2]